MMLLRRPSFERVQRFLNSRTSESFSYSQVGATRGTAPTGFTVDHNRAQIGSGQVELDSAREAIRQWKLFDLGWLNLVRSRALRIR
jgi:uncharacterized protein (UPF0548 family)